MTVLLVQHSVLLMSLTRIYVHCFLIKNDIHLFYEWIVSSLVKPQIASMTLIIKPSRLECEPRQKQKVMF